MRSGVRIDPALLPPPTTLLPKVSARDPRDMAAKAPTPAGAAEAAECSGSQATIVNTTIAGHYESEQAASSPAFSSGHHRLQNGRIGRLCFHTLCKRGVLSAEPARRFLQACSAPGSRFKEFSAIVLRFFLIIIVFQSWIGRYSAGTFGRAPRNLDDEKLAAQVGP
jgi:hypothetical protein